MNIPTRVDNSSVKTRIQALRFADIALCTFALTHEVRFVQEEIAGHTFAFPTYRSTTIYQSQGAQ